MECVTSAWWDNWGAESRAVCQRPPPKMLEVYIKLRCDAS